MRKALIQMLAVASLSTVPVLMGSTPAGAHPAGAEWRLGEHTAWAQCLSLQSGRFVKSYVSRMTSSPGFSNLFNVGGGMFGGGGNAATYSAQWLQYRVLVYWTDAYGRTFYRSGNWIGAYGELGGHVPLTNIYVQQPNGTWLQAAHTWGMNIGGGREDVSLVSGLARGRYTIWAQFQWGPIKNTLTGQLVYNGATHNEPMGQITCL